MGNAVQWLANLYDQGGGDLSRLRLDSLFGEQTGSLLEQGLFGPAARQTEAPCRCPEGDHAAAVQWVEARGAYRARCPKGDLYWMDPDAVETHAFDPEAFCRSVSVALDAEPRKGRSLPEGAVRYLGDARLGQTRFPVLLVRNLLSPGTLDTLLDHDSRKTGHSRGLFLCAALPAEAIRRDRFHAIVTFSEVLDLQDGQLRRRPDGLRRALGDAIKPMSPSERAGRLRALAAQFSHAHSRLPSVRELEGYAADNWPEDQTAPGRTSCNAILKDMRGSKA